MYISIPTVSDIKYEPIKYNTFSYQQTRSQLPPEYDYEEGFPELKECLLQRRNADLGPNLLMIRGCFESMRSRWRAELEEVVPTIIWEQTEMASVWY